MIEEYRPLTIICGTDSFCPIFREFRHADLDEFIYLGPKRAKAKRYLEIEQRDMPHWYVPDRVGRSGEFLLDLLFDQAGLVEQTNAALKQMKIPYAVRIEVAGVAQLWVERRASDRFPNSARCYADAGMGFQQLLPVIVQCLLPKHKTLLIEQPEAYIHPAHQVELGDLFIRSALGEQKNTLLVKTHSENMILRILRRIQETTYGELPEGFPAIRPEDVVIWYVQPTVNGGPKSTEIPVDEEGDFTRPWPQGFFDGRIPELF